MMVVVLSLQRRTYGPFELRCVVGGKVGELPVLSVTPAGLDRIQLGSVGRQPFELDVLDPGCGDPLRGRTMYLPAIPADDQRAPQLPPKLLDEGDGLGGAHMVVMNLKRCADAAPRRREYDRADHAQSVVAVPSALNRCLSAECPRPAVHRLQAKACFVDKDNVGSPTLGFFLMRGQSLRRHRSTASGSCSRATCRGICGLKPRSCMIRPKWSGWYDTRNCFRTIAATRPQVHRSVRNPAASGPATKVSINCRFCFSDNLLARGGCGLAANASTPPAFHALFQRFTLDRSTPNSRAISCRGFRSWKYSAARRRRASSSAALPGGLMKHNTLLATAKVLYQCCGQ